MEKALVIFSGGQDSTTCLYWAIKRYSQVAAITFSYGQKHQAELDQAKIICQINKVPQTVISLDFLRQISESPLIQGGSTLGENEKGFAAAYVPNRNQLFITLAHSFAQKIGANVIVMGVCQTDEQGFPDCRLSFINSIMESTNKGSGLKAEERIEMRTPLMHLTKAETFALAEEEGVLGAILLHSHTCYENNREYFHDWGYGCGDCPACEERRKGWLEYMKL